MKPHKLTSTIQTTGLILLSSLLGYLLSLELWFTSIFIGFLILLLAGISYRQQQKTTDRMKQLISAIRFSDFTLTFQSAGKKEICPELAAAMDKALLQFRNKLRDAEEQHQYYDTLLSTIDSGMLVINRNGQVEWSNKTARKELNKTRLEQIDELTTVHPSLPNLLRTLLPGEIKILRLEKEGQLHEIAISGIIFKIRGKELILASLKNIHSVLETNEIESWQKLIRVLTHEIMNSIAPIISLSETITERTAENGQNEKEYAITLQAMQTIHRRSKGLLNFVENYRKLTRLPTPVPTPVSIDELFTDLQKLYTSKTIDYTFRNECQNQQFMADRTQIEQILINLIRNAEEACREYPTPHIEISATHTATHQLYISVHDNGKGIIPEALDKIFVPFFTTKPGGSGIGLSLCKQIMNLHGGSISVTTEPAKGSTFTLLFHNCSAIQKQ